MSALPVHAEPRQGARGPHAAETARQLFERHRQRIFAYCLSRLRNRQEAEDAVQSTFLYACSQLGRGVVPENELAWLFTIAHNVCRSRRRALWRRGRVETATDPDLLAEAAPASSLTRRDELAGLRAALASMPDTQRKALLLREWQGLSYAEIADQLMLSESAVETLLFRARRNLADRLAPAAEKVAVILNLPVLLRLARRLVGGGLNAKTATAAVMAAGVVAGAGVPLEHSLNQHTPATLKAQSDKPRLTGAVNQVSATGKLLTRRVTEVASARRQTGAPATTRSAAAVDGTTPAGATATTSTSAQPTPAPGQGSATATTNASATTQAPPSTPPTAPSVQVPSPPSLPADLPQLPALPQLPSLPQLPLPSGSSSGTTPLSTDAPSPGTQPVDASVTTSTEDSSGSSSTTTAVSLPSITPLP